MGAFEAGAHLLSEKPLSLDFAEGVHTVLTVEDAWLAGEGTGLLCPGDDAPDHSEGRVFLPDPERSGYYRDRLAVYRELYGALRPQHAAR